MADNPLKKLETFGQSIWLDYISRALIVSGRLRALIREDGVRGLTSNPAIFEKAITQGHDYDTDIREMALKGLEAKVIYEAIAIKDVQMAADEFRPVYDSTNGDDGYVSIEVNPHLAHDILGTLDEARRLWKLLDRPNVFIKVPATDEGMIIIKQLTVEGININITLLFGISRYREAVEAYISGLEERLQKGGDLTRIASVASFFLSRIDAFIDPLLEKIIEQDIKQKETAIQLLGNTAIASAKIANRVNSMLFNNERFMKLIKHGARAQKVLWASTKPKNPEYSDIKYIEALIGPHTISTLPVETINAYRNHGNPRARLDQDAGHASIILELLLKIGIDIDEVAQKLEDEGIEKFTKPFDKLMDVLMKIPPLHLTK